MQTNNRKFERFDIPLIVKFRPTYGSTEYSLGLTKNFSFEGLGLESHDFNFIPNENLELNLKFPQRGTFVSLLGDVVWKKQVEDKCVAGIRLKMENETVLGQVMEKISAYGNIPLDNIMAQKETSLTGDQRTTEDVTILQTEQKHGLSKKENKPGFLKQYVKKGSKCKVTFRLPKEAAPHARTVTIVGDFNGWDTTRTPMTKMKNGEFVVTLDLKSKREYRFKYLIDGERWENDWHADRYDPNEYGADDSVLIV